MSQYHRFISSFLAKTFYPVNVSFTPLVNSLITYSNPLFSVRHNFDGQKQNYITFDFALNNYLSESKNSKNYKNYKLNTPESFIKYMCDKPKEYTSFETKQNKKNKQYEFNTNGLIPLRYIDMINDFSSHKFEYKKPSQIEIKEYELKIFEKIVDFNEKMLYDMYKYAQHLSVYDKYMKIIIKNAPKYQPNNNFLKKYYENSFRNPISQSEAEELINLRYWYSGDGDMSSPSTKIFFNRTSKLKSLNNIGYKKLFSASGGINFLYADALPWFELKKNMSNKQIYYDMSGNNTYHSYCDGIGVTEFIIFSEALAKEGAEYMLEYN